MGHMTQLQECSLHNSILQSLQHTNTNKNTPSSSMMRTLAEDGESMTSPNVVRVVTNSLLFSLKLSSTIVILTSFEVMREVK